MTDREDHNFDEGTGFGDPYEGFDIDPPELDVDPDKVDPVDSRALTDMLDRRSVDDDQVDAEELIDVGLNYIEINRYEQATDTFERAAKFTDDPGIEQEARVNKGAAHAELEEYDEAIGSYQEAIRIRDEGEHAASAHANLAYALWSEGQGEQALEHSERAVELDDRMPQAWYNRGFFLLERGLAEDALNSLDNAIRLGFRAPEVLEEKVRALEKLGKYDRAEEVANEAEELREAAEQQLVNE